MTTFEQAKSEVKSYIDGKLRPEINIDVAAEEYVWQGIERGDNGDGEMNAEIRATDSRTGTPVPFSFSAVDAD